MKPILENWREFLVEGEIPRRQKFSDELCDLEDSRVSKYISNKTVQAQADAEGDSFEGQILKLKLGRDIKKLYNKHVDRPFLESLKTIHWTKKTGAFNILKTFLKSNAATRDELSCAAYLPGEGVGEAFSGDYGFVVKGYISLLANDMNSMFSGSGEAYAVAAPDRTKSSGTNKGVGYVNPCEDYAIDRIFVFDQDDWNPKERSGRANEALVDNWKLVAFICPADRIKGFKDIINNKLGMSEVQVMTRDEAGAL